MELDPRSLYYALQALSYFAVYSAVFIGSGVSLWRLGSTLSNCALRPTIVPLKLFLTVLSDFGYLSGCFLVPSLFVAAAFPGYFGARALAAIVATAFHLSDCSRTGAHNGYLMLWNVWTFCLLPLGLSLGLAFGAAVWFILSSGLSKVWIGGFTWCHPDTMKSILSSFVYKTPKAGGPVINGLCRLSIKFPVLCGVMGSLTIIFEVIFVPVVAVFAPRSWQILSAILMVLLHFGIAIVQSSAIGVFFLPNVASYAIGFYDFQTDLISEISSFVGFPIDLRWSSPAGEEWEPLQGQCWYVGIVLNIAAISYTALRRRLIAEDWPLTPMALFPWNGYQWRQLHSVFVEGSTRMVALPPEMSEYLEANYDSKLDWQDAGVRSSINNMLIGVPVVPIVGASKLKDDENQPAIDAAADYTTTPSLWKYLRHNIFGTSPFAKDLRAYAMSKAKKSVSSDSCPTNPLLKNGGAIESLYVYDIWTRVLGPTTFQEEFLPPLGQDLFSTAQETNGVAAGLPLFMKALQTWLLTSKRLVEVSTGRTITDCAFARVDKDDIVAEVLSWGRTSIP